MKTRKFAELREKWGRCRGFERGFFWQLITGGLLGLSLLLLLPNSFPLMAADFTLPPPGDSFRGYWEWYAQDQKRLQGYWENGGLRGAREVKTRVVEEWAALAAALEDLYLHPTYEDPERHYYVYDVAATSRLHVLALAKEARQELARSWVGDERVGSEGGFVYPAWSSLSYITEDALGEDLLRLQSEELPAEGGEGFACIPWEEVRDCLNSLELPAATLSGCRIFLLPGEISGAAGFSVTSSLPLREEKIFLSGVRDRDSDFSLAAVLTHEVGHYLHQQFMGDYCRNPELWEEYLLLREKKSFCGEGRWSDLTEENLAEDFKVLFGNSEAQKEGHRGSYGDPRLNPEKAASLKRFIKQLPEKEEPLPLALKGLVISEAGKESCGLQIAPWQKEAAWLTFSSTVCFSGELEGPPAAGAGVGLAVEKDSSLLYALELNLEEEGGSRVFKRQVTFPYPGHYRLMVGAMDKGKNELTVYITVDAVYLPW